MIYTSFLDVLDDFRAKRFSGSVRIGVPETALSIWFVRGNIAHAETPHGVCGWSAMESAKSLSDLAIRSYPGELPPQRTIRVETERLIRAMKSFQKSKRRYTMNVPVPFHSRLQSRFQELKRRVSGLESYESSKLPNSDACEKAESLNELSTARTIVEKDPRGSSWTHLNGDRQLVVRGDESVSTSELMWAGSELWKEFTHLNSNEVSNEQ